MRDNISILSANMNRQHDALISLLETISAHILLIQEPSWSRLVPKKSDDDPEGVIVKGTCSHPKWRSILPLTAPSNPQPHVAIFLHTDITSSTTYSVLPDMNSYNCLGLRLDTEVPLIFINYYHHVTNKRPNLHHLLSLPLPDSPLLLCGDFNTHSHSWSPPDIIASPWAHTLEDWLEENQLISLVPEGSITRRGTGKASLIDHIFVNLPFLEQPLFPASCSASFEKLISSDHAALCLDLPLHTLPPPPSVPLGWIIEDQMEQDWKHAFSIFPRPLITDVPSLSRASIDLVTLTEVTCDKFFARKKPPGPRSAAWWNKACSIAAAEVSRAHGPTRRHLSKVLRATIRHAQREWLEGLITDPSTSIWDLAKWRHGRRSPWLPAINGSSDPETMGASFRERFFSFPKPPEPSLELPGQAAP